MKKVKNFFFPLVVILGVFSCKKAVEENSDYIGRWIGRNGCSEQLEITPGSYATYKYRDNQTDCQRGWKNGKARIQGGNLRIGTRKFTIALPPTAIDTITITRSYYPSDPPPIPEKSVMKMVLFEYDTLYKVIE